MPKKGPKNAYFYFMIDFREEEKKRGNIYANMQEVQKAADPVWRGSSPAVRAKYEKIAKQEKARHNILPDQKFTSFGVPFSQLEDEARLAKEAVDRELQYIQNFVFKSNIGKKFLDENIYVIDVNALCETTTGYVFGEFAVIRFNIRNGIVDHIHRIINPPDIPVGYASDIRLGCEAFALEVPDSEGTKSDYLKILALIVTYLKENDPDSNILPPLYTLPEKEDQVLHFIGQLCNVSLEDVDKFQIYKLDVLFFYLINTIKTHNNEGLPKESLALAALRKDPFKYSPGLGCKYHESGERPTECCKARVTRWAYTILDSCCPVAGVEAVPGKHLPAGIDIEAVLSYKEKKIEGGHYPHAGPAPNAWSRASSVGDSYESLSQTAASSTVRAKPTAPRVLKPLRTPGLETLEGHSQVKVTPPELSSNTEFPPMNVNRRGPGRNIRSTLQGLVLNEPANNIKKTREEQADK